MRVCCSSRSTRCAPTASARAFTPEYSTRWRATSGVGVHERARQRSPDASLAHDDPRRHASAFSRRPRRTDPAASTARNRRSRRSSRLADTGPARSWARTCSTRASASTPASTPTTTGSAGIRARRRDARSRTAGCGCRRCGDRVGCRSFQFVFPLGPPLRIRMRRTTRRGTTHSGRGGKPYEGEVRVRRRADWTAGSGRGRERAAGPLVVAVTGDHGESLGQHGEPTHGMLLDEAALRVPLVIAAWRDGSAVTLGASSDNRPVSLQDVAPTLLTLAGAPVPADMTGAALFGLLQAPGPMPQAPGDSHAESVYPRTAGWSPVRSITGWPPGS